MDVHAYLARIGYEGPLEPTAETLRALHRQHMLTVPFENLDIHRGRQIVLDPDRFVDKIVGRRRGGFCYELNGAFGKLLAVAGFPVTLISARVSNTQGKLSPEFDHLALRVDLDEPWLADVGFGDSFIEPLRIASQVEQRDPAGRFRLINTGERWRLERHQPDGDWRPQYDFSLLPRRLSGFTGRCRYHQTSAESHFMQHRICSLATSDGRITLADMRLVVTSDGRREEQTIATESEWHVTLFDRFGIVLDDPHPEPRRHANSVDAHGVW